MQQAFAGMVDYAGLFPPASLGMAESLRNYEAYRRSTDRWALGRYVVAAQRLQELHETLLSEEILPSAADPWHLSLVLGNIVPTEVALIDAFRALRSDGSVVIDAVEFRVSTAGQIEVVSRDLPQGVEQFLEVPQGGPYDKLVRVIAAQKRKAKLRTGGSEPGLFPRPDAIIDFIGACVTHQVPFKFTAGLHHPWRGYYPITYERDAPQQLMYGFIPLLLATAEIARGGDRELAIELIGERDRDTFERHAEGLAWGDLLYPWHDLEVARRFFTGFGSCSFVEPLEGISESLTV